MSLKLIVMLFLIINIISYVSMMLDKWFAVKNKWRLSEAYLLSCAFFGGGLGTMMGMISFRHKLSKVKFRVISTFGILWVISLFTYFILSGKIIFFK